MEFIIKLAKKNNRILSKEQLLAANHIDGPALTLAVPGSGKTTLMLYRAANLIHKTNIDPKSLLTLTFSKSAANDMSIRYRRDILPYTNKNIKISTIHSFCLSILRAYNKHINKPLNIITDYGSNSKSHIISNIYKNNTEKFITPEILEEISRCISFKKNQFPATNNSNSDNAIPLKLIPIDLFHTLFFEYEIIKKQNNLIDFDDMLTHSLAILNNHPKTVNYYQNKYKYIQIDEAQDTSSIQNHIISIIAGQTPNLFMVADDDQSIYEFRGASPHELLRFQQKYKSAQIYYLSQNYRCSSDITRTCQALIKNNELRYDKKMYLAPSDNKPVSIRYFESPEQRHNYIIDKISHAPTAILYRNHISAIPIIDFLERSNCHFKIKDYGISLSENRIVKDIFSFFNLALTPQDKEAFYRIAYKLDVFVNKSSLEFIRTNHLTQGVFQTLRYMPNQSSKQTQNWIRLQDQFERIKFSSPYTAIKIIETDLGYIKNLKAQCSKLKLSFASLKSILDILKQIAKHEDNLIDFMARIRQIDNIAQSATKNTSSTQLLTIHSSKGLEFEQVLLIDIDKGILPSQKTKEDDPKQWEEERRLLYVAMSRAKTNLEILQIKFWDNKLIQHSPFIDEIKDCESVNIIQTQNNLNTKNTAISYSDIKIGSYISHTHFGIGEIKEISGDKISIQFERGIKTLSIAICKSQGLLELSDS